MAKIRYKEISTDMADMVAPSDVPSSRFSIGMQDKIGEYYYVDIENLEPYKNQARRNFNVKELEELAETIKNHGIRQPLTIIPSSHDKSYYEVVSGERRLKAAKIAGLKKVPCIIIKDPEQAKEISLIENVQRTDLHPVELADAYHKILDKSSYGGVTALAKRVGKPVSSISEIAKIHTLPEEIKAYLIEKNIRSKIVFRKLLLLPHIEDMKEYLGMTESGCKVPKSILRILLTPEGFLFESKAIKTLSNEQKKSLKRSILEMIQNF